MDPIFLGGAAAIAVFFAAVIGGVVGAAIATPGPNPHRCPPMPAPPPPSQAPSVYDLEHRISRLEAIERGRKTMDVIRGLG